MKAILRTLLPILTIGVTAATFQPLRADELTVTRTAVAVQTISVPAYSPLLEDAVFVGEVPGAGFPPGTIFESPESIPLGLEVDGFVVVDGDGNPIPMAFSSDRTVTIVSP